MLLSSLVNIVPDLPYQESLQPNAFQTLGFWMIMQRNFNTVKINNKNYMLKYALSTVHNFFHDK